MDPLPFSPDPDPPDPLLSPIAARIARSRGRDLDLDDLKLTSLVDLDLPAAVPDLEALSLWGNDLADLADILAVLAGLPKLRGLWLQGNPVAASSEEVLRAFPNLEILNSKLTSRYTEWALLYLARAADPETVAYLDFHSRGITALNPTAFAPFTNLSKVDFRGNPVDLSAVDRVIPTLKSVNCDDGSAIPESIVFVNGVDRETGDVSLPIPDRIWEHIQPAGPLWGLGDEVALSIHHSLTPNCAAMPCGSPSSPLTYFVFWPIAPVAAMDEVTANLFPLIGFAPIGPPLARLVPMPLKSPFKSTVTTKRPILVYTDLKPFAEHLHSDTFALVETPESADLLWIAFREQEDFSEIYERRVLFSQIEGESHITIKDLMYETVQQFMGPVPWLPQTFILSEPDQVTAFVKRDRELKASGQCSAWVVKAFNQTRANFMLVTESVSEVLRHASIDPRLCQRYIWNPLLIFGVKFDLRFIVLLKSVKPMELFAYKVFWPRLAPKRWALDQFDDYERHFTVMNYRAPGKVTPKTWVDFVEQFEIENTKWKWVDVLSRIYSVIRDLFVCGCQKMVASPYTKAMYGIDVMITREMQPVILECNFMPDCHRACELCPTFVNDVFEVLFVEQPVVNERVIQIPL
jgi:tubulin--tyrosine ligase-like protein 12